MLSFFGKLFAKNEFMLSGNKKNWWIFFLSLVVGFISGSLVSQLLKMVLPTGVVRDFLTYSVDFGIKTVELNLGILKIVFGLNFSFTIVSLLFIACVVYYFKWWL